MKDLTIAQQIQYDLLTNSDNEIALAESVPPTHIDLDSPQRELRSLGFNRASVVLDTDERHEQRILAQQVKVARNKYHPYRFITDGALAQVCGNYELRCVPVDDYTGAVPAWAVERITKFDKSFPGAIARKRAWHSRSFWGILQAIASLAIGLYFASDPGCPSIWFCIPFGIGAFVGLLLAQLMVFGALMRAPFEFVLFQPTLHIACPRSDSYTAQTDPIVYLEVPGGGIVVAAWGPEGEDPAILNPLDN